MILAMCLGKNKDANGKVVSYALRDFSGKRLNVDGKQIKDAIRAKKIKVFNLEVSDSGRLVDKPLSKAEMVLIDIIEAFHDLDEAECDNDCHNRFDGDIYYCTEYIQQRIEKYFGFEIFE